MAIEGGKPEAEATRKLGGTTIHQFEGPTANGILSLTVNPDRYDWILRPVDGQHDVLPTLPSVGGYKDVNLEFLNPMNRWVESAPECSRFAMGLVAIHPVPSVPDGYELLNILLNDYVKLDPHGSSDFMYRINRPRPSNVIPGLKINRLTEWSVAAKFQIFQDGNVLPPVGSAVRVAIDLSTDQYFAQKLGTQQQGHLLFEFQAYLQEFLEKGDIQ
jgi:hypothetical protein